MSLTPAWRGRGEPDPPPDGDGMLPGGVDPPPGPVRSSPGLLALFEIRCPDGAPRLTAFRLGRV